MFSISSRAVEENPSLKFLKSGELVKELKLSELKAKLKTHKIKFYDLHYKKNMKYVGFALQDVLHLGLGDKWKSSDFTDVAFEALDGYMSVSKISEVSEPGGYIVFKDLEYKDWESVSIREANPGPFYLVWTGKDQTTQNGYPWPWQISSIDLTTFEDQYPAVFPKGALTDSAAYKGYEIFKGRCVRCHAMNKQGGKIGPDLNAPQSIISYRSENMIKEFIKHPSKYRYTHMPDHPDLSEQDLDNLISYLHYMNENRN